MLKPGLERLVLCAKAVGFSLKSSFMSLDGMNNNRKNRKAIFILV